MLLDNLASQPLDVGDAAARGGAGGPSHKLQELKLPTLTLTLPLTLTLTLA